MISAMRARVAAVAISARERGIFVLAAGWALDELVALGVLEDFEAAAVVVRVVLGRMEPGVVVGCLAPAAAGGVGFVKGSDGRGPVEAPDEPGTCF